MTESDQVKELQKKCDSLRAELVKVGIFRPGTLIERYRRCGKPGCHCAIEGSAGHGPSWSLTRAIEGKTVTKIIPEAAISATQKQIEEYKLFKQLVHDFIEVNIQLCDASLKSNGALNEAEEAKKKGSKKSSQRRSPKNSKGS